VVLLQAFPFRHSHTIFYEVFGLVSIQKKKLIKKQNSVLRFGFGSLGTVILS